MPGPGGMPGYGPGPGGQQACGPQGYGVSPYQPYPQYPPAMQGTLVFPYNNLIRSPRDYFMADVIIGNWWPQSQVRMQGPHDFVRVFMFASQVHTRLSVEVPIDMVASHGWFVQLCVLPVISGPGFMKTSI